MVCEVSFVSHFINRTRKSSAASFSSTATSKARDARRQKKRGKIRPGRYLDTIIYCFLLSLILSYFFVNHESLLIL